MAIKKCFVCKVNPAVIQEDEDISVCSECLKNLGESWDDTCYTHIGDLPNFGKLSEEEN